MAYNDFIRNEWQSITLRVDKKNPYVELTDVKCWALTHSSDMMITLSYTMTLRDTGDPADLLSVTLNMETPAPLGTIRVSTMTPHTTTTDTGTRYSTIVLELSGHNLTCTGFPFAHSRHYNVNTQFFYRV
jgi:hypothetical protein